MNNHVRYNQNDLSIARINMMEAYEDWDYAVSNQEPDYYLDMLWEDVLRTTEIYENILDNIDARN